MNDKACLHESGTEAHTTGGMHFDGEAWDDICLHGLCVDCGEHIDCQLRCKKMTQPLEEVHEP